MLLIMQLTQLQLSLIFTLLCDLERQLIFTSFKIIINPDTLILDYLLPAKSLSLCATLFMIFSFFCGVILDPLFTVSITYLITRFIYSIAFPVVPSFNLVNYLTTFEMYGSICFMRYNNIPKTVLYCSYSSLETTLVL